MNVRARFFIEKDPRDATLGKLAPSSVVFSHPACEVGGAPDVSFLEFLTPQYIDLMHEYCGQFSAACPAGGGTADAPLAQTAPAPLQMQNHIFSLAANKESHPRLVRCGHGECGQFSAACPAGGGTADAPPAQTAPAPLQICCFLAKYRMITAEMQWMKTKEIETTAAIPYIRTRNELPPRNDTLSPD